MLSVKCSRDIQAGHILLGTVRSLWPRTLSYRGSSRAFHNGESILSARSSSELIEIEIIQLTIISAQLEFEGKGVRGNHEE